MDKRLFPVNPEFFATRIEAILDKSYIGKGRPLAIIKFSVPYFQFLERVFVGGIFHLFMAIGMVLSASFHEAIQAVLKSIATAVVLKNGQQNNGRSREGLTTKLNIAPLRHRRSP